MIRKTETRNIKDIIDEIIHDCKLDKKLKEREIIRQWEEVAGLNVARSTQSIYFNQGKLFIKIRSSIIRNELIWLREDLKHELNRRAGEDIIQELVIL